METGNLRGCARERCGVGRARVPSRNRGCVAPPLAPLERGCPSPLKICLTCGLHHAGASGPPGWFSVPERQAPTKQKTLGSLPAHTPPFHAQSSAFSHDLDGDRDGEERITLFTADGLVVLSGAGATKRKRRASTTPHPRQPHPTLPPSWDRPPPPDLLAWAAGLVIQEGADGAVPLPSWTEGGLCLASPFLCRAATVGDGGPTSPGARTVSLHGWTRCPTSLAATVATVTAALRGAVLGEERLPPPPGGLAPPGTSISLTLPLLYGVPPALDALVAAIATAPGGRHVIERVTREWVVLPGRRRRG